MKSSLWMLSCSALIAVGACGKNNRDAAPVGVTNPSAAEVPPTSGSARSSDTELEPIGIIVMQEVRTLCALPAEPQSAPRFDFDSTELRPRGENILADVAACATEGRLGGAKLRLVGFADPRGTEEYNLALGQYRAEAARRYLMSLGVPTERLTTESRGERDARGTDEASWQLDRRVEVHVLPATSTPSNSNDAGVTP